MNARPALIRSIALLQKHPRVDRLIPCRVSPFRYVNACAYRRFNGTLSSPSPTSAPADGASVSSQASKPTSGSAPPSSTRRSLRPLIYATTFLFIGLTFGQYVRMVILPPPLPHPGSPEDLRCLRVLQDDANKLPMVQELRLRSHEWTELSVYGDLQESEKKSSMIAGAMGGSRGLGIQRLFWNEEEQRTICVVFLGGALAGWPGVTHGGTIATILQENIERLATISTTIKPDVVETPRKVSSNLDKLELQYLRPTLANRFYIIRTEVEGPKGLRLDANKDIGVRATLEEIVNGVVCVEATAHCTVP